MHNVDKYIKSLFMAYLLTLFGSGAVFTPEIKALATNSGQVYWFSFTCVIFCLYVIIIHYAFKFWCGKELFAQNKRDEYRSFERINLFYLAFNGLGMVVHFDFLQVVSFFCMPIILANII